MRQVTLEEVELKEYCKELAPLAKLFNHPIIEDEHGVWRWRPNKLMCLMVEGIPVAYPDRSKEPELKMDNLDELHEFHRNRKHFVASLDLNELWAWFEQGKFDIIELMQFYMDIGYSLGGFIEMFAQKEVKEWNLGKSKQNLIEFVVEKYKELTCL